MSKNRKLSIAEVDAAIEHLEKALELFNTARGSEPNKKKPNPNHSALKIGFISFYKEHKKIEYVWSAKDGTHLNYLIGKIESLINISESKDIGTVEEIFRIIISKIEKLDEFTWNNLTISMINSRFNIIISKMKNPKGTNKEIEDYKKSLEKRLNPK